MRVTEILGLFPQPSPRSRLLRHPLHIECWYQRLLQVSPSQMGWWVGLHRLYLKSVWGWKSHLHCTFSNPDLSTQVGSGHWYQRYSGAFSVISDSPAAFSWPLLSPSRDSLVSAIHWRWQPDSASAMQWQLFRTLSIVLRALLLYITLIVQFPPHTRKSWYYIIPVVLLSILINIPRFLEGVVEWDDEGPAYKPSNMRTSPNFIIYYRLVRGVSSIAKG